MRGKYPIILLAIVGGLIGLVTGSVVAPDVGTDTGPSVDISGIQLTNPVIPVHVSGAVTSPGVVWIAEGALVADAVALAGGALPEADLNAINLADPVNAGDQISVPGPANPGQPPSATSDGLIDINSADATELQRLPGVGPVLAGRIVAHRDSIGRFESVEDLLDVPGIGETRLGSMRDLIRPP